MLLKFLKVTFAIPIGQLQPQSFHAAIAELDSHMADVVWLRLTLFK